MNNITNLFSQNWYATATEAAAGYMNNYRTFFSSKIIRLLHVSIDHPGNDHITIWTTNESGAAFRLVDDDFAANHSAVWNGSMIIRNPQSVGATVYGVADGDLNWLRIIWEEIHE